MASKKGGMVTTPETIGGTTAKPMMVRIKDSWVMRNWQTALVLVMVILLAFFVRAYFAYPLSVDNGFLVSGGSDSYYHQRVIDHVTGTGQHLVYDFELNYPFGMRNARPPLYDWSVAVSGLALKALGMSLEDGVGYSLVFSTAVWGALTVIPIFMMTNTLFGRRAGLLSAFLFALMPGHIERSIFSNADHDAMVLFFVVFAFYFFMRSLQTIEGTKWVADWKDRRTVLPGLRSYIRQNQISMLYAALGGVCVSAVGMIWTGYTYILIIILVYYIAQLFIDRFKSSDSMGVMISVMTMWLVAFAVMAPLYYQMDYWYVWFDMPFILLMIGLVVGILFITTRDYPWVLMVPVILGIAAVSLVVMWLLAPEIFNAVISGQGYLVKSKLYSTISEAQAPSFSNLVMSFGALTFWLALFGVGYAAVKIPRSSSPHFVFMVIYGAVSIYMAASAGRFLFNAAPAFALLGGWALMMIIDWVKFDEYFRSLWPVLRSPKLLFRKMLKARVVVVTVLLALLLVVPNVWTAMDASIPSEEKKKYDLQIYNFMPDFLRPDGYDEKNGSSWYLGAFSYSMPLPSTYWPAAWDWYAGRDTGKEIGDRPAFVSWWDYGFEAVQKGKHPTVADNFQNGYPFAGTFILAQNETQAVALMLTRIVEKLVWKEVTAGTDQSHIYEALASYGIDVDAYLDIIRNPSNYIKEILDHPEIYGNFDTDLSAANALYVAASHELSKYGMETVVNAYHDVREITDLDIGYFAIDSRLFPFNAYTQNIFYAPAKLSDRVVDPKTGDPVDYYSIKAVDLYGNEYDLDDVPEGTTIVDYRIQYTELFYDTMLYRAFMGFGPSDVGLKEQGVPGISGSLASYNSMQAWNMSHFRMVYRTAYYNPYPEWDVRNHSDAWTAISYDEALVKQKLIDDGLLNATVDMTTSVLAGGVVFIQYYDGVILEGRVVSEADEPMSGIWVTASDEYGIPHNLVKTDENGYYSVILPFGNNITVTYSYGKLNLRSLTATVIRSDTYNITYEQAMRKEPVPVGPSQSPSANAEEGWVINQTTVIMGGKLQGKVFIDLNNNKIYDPTDILLENATVTIRDPVSGYTRSTVAYGGSYSFSALPPMSGTLWAEFNGHVVGRTTALIESGGNRTVQIAPRPAKVSNTVILPWGSAAPNVSIDLVDETNGDVITKTTDSNGYVLFENLLEGNYTLRANDSAYTLGEKRYQISAGETVVETVTLYNAMAVSGQVTFASLPVPYARVAFMTEQVSIWTVADANGHYSAVVPKLDYTVYALSVQDGQENVALKMLAATDVASVNLALSKAVIMEGTVKDGNNSVPSASIALRAPAGAVIYGQTNAAGKYRLAVPAGTYVVYAYKSDKVFWGEKVAAANVNISLTKGAILTGKVWSDVSGDGQIQTSELRGNITLTVTNSNGWYIRTVSGKTGIYSVAVPNGTDLELKVSLKYYDDVVIPMTNVSGTLSNNINLVGSVRDVSGKIDLGGSGLGDMTFEFKKNGGAAVSVNVTTDAEGRYSVQLRPGNYRLVLAQDVTAGDDGSQYQFIRNYLLNITVGQDPVVMDLEAVVRYKVTGVITPGSGSMTFIANEGDSVSLNTTGQYTVYLRQGNYSLYALMVSNTTRYVVFQKVNVSAPLGLDLTAVLAKRIDATVEHNNGALMARVKVALRDPSTGAEYTAFTSLTGTLTLYMAEGIYNVTVDHRMLTRLPGQTDYKYMRYTADINLAFDMVAKSVDIPLTRSYDNSTVNGLLADVEYRFIALSGTAIDKMFTASSGSIDLAPGNYSLYARSPMNETFLGKIEIMPYVDNELGVALGPGTSLSGVVRLDGVAVPAKVKVSSGEAYHEFESEADGSYQVWLPAGTYTVTATANKTDQGILVKYKGTKDVDLSSASVVNIDVTKVVEYSVSLSWDGIKQTVSAGGSAAYNVRVRNTGNAIDSYELNATASGWNISISQRVIENVPYGTDGYVNVTVTLTPGSTVYVKHAMVVLKAKSITGSGASAQLGLDVNIEPRYDINITYVQANAQNASSHVYKYLVKNTGNADDNYHVEVANAAELLAKGWNATIRVGETGGFSRYVNMSLDAGRSRNVEVSLTRVGESQDPNVNITLMVKSRDDSARMKELTMTAVFPDLTIPEDGGLTVEGVGVKDKLPEIPLETYVAFTVLVLLAALAVYYSYQRGVFGRRK
ncbi:MAG: glycosyltransferase family 39 protein [Methanomassiliicoccales archaeon]|nr:MAG: glycosyltransferase family 39 protein [Methanomassiliicoccales archaeon]